MSYLNCSRCHLSIRAPREPFLAPEYCPRCIARSRVPTRMFASPLTMRELTGERDPRSEEREAA